MNIMHTYNTCIKPISFFSYYVHEPFDLLRSRLHATLLNSVTRTMSCFDSESVREL